MSTALPPPVDISSQIRNAQLAAFKLMNCGDEDLELQYHGNWFLFEPMAPTPIKPIMEWKRGQKGRILREESRYTPEGLEPWKVAEQLINSATVRGLVVLLGDPGDPERIKVGRNRAMRHKLEIMRSVQSGWVKRVERLTKNDPNVIPPRQPQHVAAAINWLAKYENDLFDREPYIAFDGADFKTRAEVEAYLRLVWPGRVQALQGAVMLGSLYKFHGAGSAEPVRSAGEAPLQPVPTQAQAEVASEGVAKLRGDFFVDKADKLGVQLSNSEILGLFRDDSETVEVVAGKLAQVESKQLDKERKKAEAAEAGK